MNNHSRASLFSATEMLVHLAAGPSLMAEAEADLYHTVEGEEGAGLQSTEIILQSSDSRPIHF